MRKQIALVFGGGGARGALQAGALRALIEAHIQPDLLVGTSAGAVNAAYVAARGYTAQTVEDLIEVWRTAASADLLPIQYPWFAVRLLLRWPSSHPNGRLHDFYIQHGMTPKLRFEQLPGPRLFVVAADLKGCRSVIYGQDPTESVLEAMAASSALPPWVLPLEVRGRLVMDGGLTSNLPIEPALSRGATEIIALDIDDTRIDPAVGPGLAVLLNSMIVTAQQREKEMELALAAARRVRVQHIALQLEKPLPFWDFSHTNEAIERGYRLAKEVLGRRWRTGRPLWPAWPGWLRLGAPGAGGR